MTRVLACVVLVCASHRCSAQKILPFYTGPPALRDAKLPATVKRDIVRAIAAKFEPMPDTPSGRTIALGSWVTRLRLSASGPPAIVVKGGPDDPNNGATGNVDIWVFRIVGRHARLILSSGGYDLSPRSSTYHHGWRDVETAWKMSCCDGAIERDRFDGVRYRPLYCYSYQNPEDGDTTYSRHQPCPAEP